MVNPRTVTPVLILCGTMLGAALPTQAQTISAGASHTVVVTPDGSVWTFGANSYGQLGDGSTNGRLSPTEIRALSGIVAVAAGADHTLAVDITGTVWAWGRNASGQLGDGTTANRTAPVIVSGLPPVSAVAAGTSHSVALATDGTIWTWGANTNGQLGNGTTTRSLLPIMLAPGWTAIAVAAGHSHTLAIRSDGTLWGWGANGSGQLGTSSPSQWTVPGQIAGVQGAVAATGGSCFTAVLRSDGRVLTSGCNGSGQLGNNTTTNRPSMDLVIGIESVTTIRAGSASVSGLTAGGEIWSWGQNLYGQIGNGGTSTQRLPVRTLTAGIIAHLAAGHTHGGAVTATGIVFTWGANASGQLGDGTTIRRTTPVAISDIDYAWKVATPTLTLAAGSYTTDQATTVANTTPGAELHYTTDGSVPTQADQSIPSGTSLAVDRTMILSVRAWKDGMPPSDVVSATYTMNIATPAVSPSGGTYTQPQTVTVSTTTPNVTLRYTTDGSTPTESSAIYTVPLYFPTTTTLKVIGFRDGWNNSSQRSATYKMNFGTLPPPDIAPGEGMYITSVVVTLSSLPGATIRYTTNGNTPNTLSPIYSEPLTVSTSQTIKAIAYHPDYSTSPVTTAVYVIDIAGPVFTPGGGVQPPGQAITIASETPGATIRYTLDGRDPTDSDPIIPSGDSIVAANYTLKARAWKPGCATSPTTTATYQVSGPLTGVQVNGGTSNSILVRPDGLAWAWGWLAGNGVIAGSLLPFRTGSITGAVAVATGGNQSLVSTVNGSLYSWGNLVGDATTTQRTRPVLLTTISGVAKVSAGGGHSAVLKHDGTVWTWGTNSRGQLGDGTTSQRTSPGLVSGLTGVTAVATGDAFTLALTARG